MARPCSPTRTAFVVGLVLAAASVMIDALPATSQGDAGRPSRTGCARGEPAPLLVSAAGRSTPVFVRNGDGEGLETFQVDRETKLAIRHFGCAHFALEFTFVTRTGPSKSPTAWPARSARWLRDLPVTSTQRGFVDHIARQLDDAAARGYAPGASLQVSETATLTMHVHRGASGTRVVILYDVAL